MAHDWNIRPRSRVCAICGKEFEAGEDCLSALFETSGGFERQDFCPACFPKREENDSPFSIWQGAIAPSQKVSSEKAEPIKKETAETLLRRLLELDNPENIGAVYVLAVMLERKKVLVERATKLRPEGGILRVYEQKSTGDTFLIIDPQLRLNEIGALQSKVMELLG